MGTWTDPPLLWFKPDHDVEVVSNLEAGTLRIHLQVSPSERRLQALGLCIAFFVFSLLPSMLVLSWHSESSADDVTRQRQTSCAGLGMSTLLLGDDDVYCIDPMFPDDFQSDDSWQLGDEQHLAIGSDGDGGYAEEYRWGAVEHWVVYGYVWEGRYSYHIYIPETNLPSDWNLTHLMSPFPEGSWPA